MSYVSKSSPYIQNRVHCGKSPKSRLCCRGAQKKTSLQQSVRNQHRPQHCARNRYLVYGGEQLSQ
ncbi:hypothetical protein Lal_00034509 [Lupinus albus]|nr:hypothetical protein Lal_00034509 [Lupinus albus]